MRLPNPRVVVKKAFRGSLNVAYEVCLVGLVLNIYLYKLKCWNEEWSNLRWSGTAPNQ